MKAESFSPFIPLHKPLPSILQVPIVPKICAVLIMIFYWGHVEYQETALKEDFH